MLAMCVLDGTELAWTVAELGLVLYGIRDACPPSGMGPMKRLSQSACAIDVSAVIYAFGKIASFIAIAIIHCTNALEFKLLCGAGVSVLVSSAAALGVSGAGLSATCDLGIKMAPLSQIAAQLSEAGLSVRRLESDAALRQAEDIKAVLQGLDYNYSDKAAAPPDFEDLDEALRVINALDAARAFGPTRQDVRGRFASPGAVWQHMGHNLSEAEALEDHPHPGDAEAFVRLMQPVLEEEHIEIATANAPRGSRLWQLTSGAGQCL